MSAPINFHCERCGARAVVPTEDALALFTVDHVRTCPARASEREAGAKESAGMPPIMAAIPGAIAAGLVGVVLPLLSAMERYFNARGAYYELLAMGEAPPDKSDDAEDDDDDPATGGDA